MSKRDDYEVGYGKPPKRTRFAKGRSGNPNGRPKGHKSFAAELQAELDTAIAVTERGKRRSIRAQTVLIKGLLKDALQGNARAREQIIRLIAVTEAKSPESSPLVTQEDDARILERFAQRLRLDGDAAPRGRS